MPLLLKAQRIQLERISNIFPLFVFLRNELWAGVWNRPVIQKDSIKFLIEYASRFWTAWGKLKHRSYTISPGLGNKQVDQSVVLPVSVCKRVNILSDFRWRREKICTHFQRTEAQETRGSLREVRPQRGTCRLRRPTTPLALLSEARQCHFVPTRLKRNAATLMFTLLKLTLRLFYLRVTLRDMWNLLHRRWTDNFIAP